MQTCVRKSVRSQIRPEQRTIRKVWISKTFWVTQALANMPPGLKARMELRMPIYACQSFTSVPQMGLHFTRLLSRWVSKSNGSPSARTLCLRSMPSQGGRVRCLSRSGVSRVHTSSASLHQPTPLWRHQMSSGVLVVKTWGSRRNGTASFPEMGVFAPLSSFHNDE